MKVIIAGPRYKNPKTKEVYTISGWYDFAEEKINELDMKIDEIVSGKAVGFDTIGECYAFKNNIQLKEFPITSEDWKTLGKRAGSARNKQMGDYADSAIIFWDGKSSGTKNMIYYMKKLKKPYKVIMIEQSIIDDLTKKENEKILRIY